MKGRKCGGRVSGMPMHLVNSRNKRKQSLQGFIGSHRLNIWGLTGLLQFEPCGAGIWTMGDQPYETVVATRLGTAHIL